MDISITRADLDDPALADFLLAHLRDMEPTAPPESRHALDLAALRAPGVRLWTLHRDGELAGTVALAAVEPDHEELKSMRVAPSARGLGIGHLLLRHVLDDARARGVERVSLETGSQEFFAPARALYIAHGFAVCPPFGGYIADPNSVFLTRMTAEM
ncbi:GNAT family N-acetyltransferase [Tsukamurella pseudospumae]|uniref:GCN5 family acetyltransferase n=1 Tax=Tsukamurella pseudospumae TaxID=239498 RepID=A0A138ABL5_9ACTN|nr:GNAT family N-acetyltransferase [Tsukamurella pseudospumae]KXP07891.1 GCN5 family acetyltransferase [Tsukamurella pseudospumae]